jgi:hypothetical protein
MPPLTTTRAIGLLAAGALLIAACGGAGSNGTPTQGAGTTAPATTVPVTPTEAPGLSFDPGASLDLSSFHGDTDLEDMIPDSVGGETLTVLSMTGDQFLGGAGSPELEAALTALGKTPKDLSVAFAGSSSVSVFAFRVKGVPADTLFTAFKSAETDGFTTETASYGGKSVTKIGSSDGTESFIYLKDDTMFVVGGSGSEVPSDALLNEAFQKLP